MNNCRCSWSCRAAVLMPPRRRHLRERFRLNRSRIESYDYAIFRPPLIELFARSFPRALPSLIYRCQPRFHTEYFDAPKYVARYKKTMIFYRYF